MMLVELTTVPPTALPVQGFRDHLRLGTGFADDAVQDTVLEGCLRAAITAIEGRTGKALFRRSFSWSLAAWRDLGRQVLPVAPVAAVTGLVIVDRSGGATVIDPAGYRLEADAHRPAVVALGLVLPTIPVGGAARIEFDAGHALAWSGVPADLAQATMLLAAHYYEHRLDPSDAGGIPKGVASLIERHRSVRLFGGGL